MRRWLNNVNYLPYIFLYQKFVLSLQQIKYLNYDKRSRVYKRASVFS